MLVSDQSGANHEYVVSIQVWKAGMMLGVGSMAVTVKSDGTPEASLFHKEVCNQGAKQNACDASNIIVVGVFKL